VRRRRGEAGFEPGLRGGFGFGTGVGSGVGLGVGFDFGFQSASGFRIGFGSGVALRSGRRLARRLAGSGLDPHLGHPAEAVARHGQHGVLRLPVVAHRAPRAHDDLAELRIGYVAAPEDRSNQFVAGDRPVAVLDQVQQAFEHARLQGDRLAVPAEFARRGVQHAGAEVESQAHRKGTAGTS
jgi:hypothetical protein